MGTTTRRAGLRQQPRNAADPQRDREDRRPPRPVSLSQLPTAGQQTNIAAHAAPHLRYLYRPRGPRHRGKSEFAAPCLINIRYSVRHRAAGPVRVFLSSMLLWPYVAHVPHSERSGHLGTLRSPVQITCAMRYLWAGIDTSVIALWLGHETRPKPPRSTSTPTSSSGGKRSSTPPPCTSRPAATSQETSSSHSSKASNDYADTARPPHHHQRSFHPVPHNPTGTIRIMTVMRKAA